MAGFLYYVCAFVSTEDRCFDTVIFGLRQEVSFGGEEMCVCFYVVVTSIGPFTWGSFLTVCGSAFRGLSGLGFLCSSMAFNESSTGLFVHSLHRQAASHPGSLCTGRHFA